MIYYHNSMFAKNRVNGKTQDVCCDVKGVSKEITSDLRDNLDGVYSASEKCQQLAKSSSCFF